jgi:pyruvate/2-oxoglutarate dehydrogenase complex dihydrolipoamide acyltransferase (E2) component
VRSALPILLALAALVAGCGGDDADEAAATQPVATQTEPATTEAETEPATTAAETTTEPGASCSIGDVRPTLSEQELPPAVAEVRRRIFEAAVACDYETLEEIALERGEGFTFSYGGSEDASEFWREVEAAAEERPLPMRALATILTMPVTRNEAGSYAWPTAYSENPTEEAWRDLVYAGLYTAEEVETMQTQGTGYLGYRTAITPDGDWQFFVAGD